MIPTQLTVQNFMAYLAPQTIDFTDMHVACLTGENGAGKSALLDAITWALWGKARTRIDDDLIHLGETEMMVEFSFELGDTLYRVLRRRKMGKRGKTELHLHGFVPEAGDWRTLTEGGIRGTQAKINRLLRLDYDTFINSAFLLQGRADEFTTKTPSDRKQILGDILGLSIYDDLENRAAERTRYFDQEIKISEAQIEQMQQEVSVEDDLRREWESRQQEAQRLLRDLQQAEVTLSDVRQRHKELDFKHRQLEDLRARLSQSQGDIDDLSSTIAGLQKKIETTRHIIDRRESIETGYNVLQTAKQTLEDFNSRLAKSSALAREQHRLESAIQRARAQIESDVKVLQSQQSDLTARAASILTLQATQSELKTNVAELELTAAALEGHRQTVTLLTDESARLQTENKQLKTEMDTIKLRLTQLEEAGSKCPVCTQPLNDDHRAAVRAQFSADGKTRGDTFRANKIRLQGIKREQKQLTAEIQRAERALRQQATLHGQMARVEEQLQRAQSAAETLTVVAEKLKLLTNRLEKNDFARDESVALAEVEQQLASLHYDARAHETARQTAAASQKFEAQWQELQHAQERLAEAEAQVQTEIARRDRLLAQTSADRETVAKLAEETAALPEVTKALTAADMAASALQRDERQARDAVVAARQRLDHLAYVAKEIGKRENELVDLKETQSIFKELRAAFGKKGVQALLIEHAIPELEEEANQILARMTDGRVNVQFVTQRAARTNDNTVETLDIRIADELGTRNYELYSGGEAFRVNFAIRIALSKVLARRAGTNLQTLVIDEGFGTQDARGRERLVEAINSIQDDFAKILVITHIDELQSAFPHHIFVQKTDKGSQIIRD